LAAICFGLVIRRDRRHRNDAVAQCHNSVIHPDMQVANACGPISPNPSRAENDPDAATAPVSIMSGI
jgi:hypothetical protein